MLWPIIKSVNQPMARDHHPLSFCLSVWQPSPAPCCSLLFFPSPVMDDPMFTPETRAGGSTVSWKHLYIPDTLVTLCQAALRPHVHPTTYCVGTSWVDLLDVQIRHLFQKGLLSSDPRVILDYIAFKHAEQIIKPLIINKKSVHVLTS